MIRRLTSIVAFLLLLSGAAPVLACMTGNALNQQENACCRAMHGNCGDMAKTGCCKTTVRTDGQPQIASAQASTDVHWVTVTWPLLEFEIIKTTPSPLPSISEGRSPPGLLSTQTTVLRI